MFGNVSSEKREPVIEDCDIRFITGISGTVASDYMHVLPLNVVHIIIG